MTEFKLSVSVTDIEFPSELMRQLRMAGWTIPTEMRLHYENRSATGPRYSIEFDMQHRVEADAASKVESENSYLFDACKLKDYVALDMTLTKQVAVETACNESPRFGSWTIENTLSLSNPVEYFLYRVPGDERKREDRIRRGRPLLQMMPLRSIIVDRCHDYDEIGIIFPAVDSDEFGSMVDRIFGKFRVRNI